MLSMEIIMNDISIVTAFFDIGRGDWTMDKGYPHYLQRTTDTYLERFEYLASLDNQIIVYTHPDFIEKIKTIRKEKLDKTKIYGIDINDIFSEKLKQISNIQKNQNFVNLINPSQVKNPEYWNEHYVLINFLKTWFVNDAINRNIVQNDIIAWIDFGYCRDKNTIGNLNKWCYNFNDDKIHVFDYREFDSNNMKILDVISNNIVHILGAKIVANKKMWPVMAELMDKSYDMLIGNGLIDDDQTLMLMSTLMAPQVFEKHRISEDNPFIIFKNFSEV